jgi:hypothetical protein
LALLAACRLYWQQLKNFVNGKRGQPRE